MLDINPKSLSIKSFYTSRIPHNDSLVHNLATNEEPLGPSPIVSYIIENRRDLIHKYPDQEASKLRKHLANFIGSIPSQIICGNGSEELIFLIARVFAKAGDEILMNEFSFPLYEIAAQTMGAIPIKAKSSGLKCVVNNILESITKKTKIIFIDNPGNPSGQYLNKDEILRLITQIPSHILIVLDAAYGEYVTYTDYSDGREFIKSHENLILLHTFSKFYGLAGLRLGWGYGSPDVIEFLNRMRAPFNVNHLSQECAPYALFDVNHAVLVKKMNTLSLFKLRENLQTFDLEVEETVTNFLFPRFQSSILAEKAYHFLEQNGILVKRMHEKGIQDRLRISRGLDTSHQYLLQVLDKFFKSQTT